ncbi:hypothetical protein ABEB36_013810 [Hypothenemus hampei]|uniref:Pre-mRNA cleavage complex 2 protein Pcf11 n=1 Tax=Hypothenemus hampei TaxID=57062 RepID=A0ABD1E5N8_HYPHA
MTTPEEIKAEYTSSLADLTFNSKPLINVLTILAEENVPNAKIIVEAIEEHLAKVPVEVKLPILYLIDCIVKNVGQTYTTLFSHNIVSTFCNVFKMVDEKTRLEMFKLRQTWNDVFPQMKLYAVDVQIRQIDPAWPVTAQPTNSIHFNPRFLINNSTSSVTSHVQTPPVNTANTAVVPPKPTPSADMETLLMQEQLIQKQKELLELQRKALELEVLQTQVKLQEQINAGQVPSVSTNILLKPEVVKQLIPDAIVNNKPAQPSNRQTIAVAPALTKPQTSQTKINPVNPALVAARPIRDPRLLRQQQKTATVPSRQEKSGSTVQLESTNKNIDSKSSVRDHISKDPSNNKDKVASKPKSSQKSRDKSSPLRREHSPKLNSTSGSSLSSSESPSKGKRSPNSKHNKKRDKESKRSHEFESGVSNKRDKLSLKEDSRKTVNDKDFSSGDALSFKSVRNKNRNYMRRNMNESPIPPHDREDDFRSADKCLRIEPPIKRKSPDPNAQNKPMDVDLRQLAPTLSKKRTSNEGSEQPSKKSKSFDVLFGSEDIDLRQLAIPPEPERKANSVGRPPTPPPPIISVEKQDKAIVHQKKSDLDAVRAKLANATNRDKVLNKSFHKNKLQQKGDQDLRPKLTISPEEEKVIQSGHMTNEEGKQMLTKILTRIEKDKLREAKRKDQEEDGIVSKQNDDGTKITSPMIFNDKDERVSRDLRNLPSQEVNSDQFYVRDGRRSFRNSRETWRGRSGVVGRGAAPTIRQSQRSWPRWRNPYQARNDYEDESSKSPLFEELTIHQEENKTLNIDGIPRDIRVYDDVAVIFINYDDPREISFQNGARRIIFNNNESVLLQFGCDYKDITVSGHIFRVKLGVPSREVFINDLGFECFFGGPPIHVTINGHNLTVALDGPPPQVKISEEKRTDLVVGKINLIINATLMIPVFLDGKLQNFVVDGESCTLKFVDALKRVLINDVSFNVEFGGLPKPCVIYGKKHFIRFSVLPKGVKPGYVKIKDMEGECGSSPVRNDKEEESQALEVEPLRPRDEDQNGGTNSPSLLNLPALNNFDVISNVLSQTLGPAPPATTGYQVELPGLCQTAPEAQPSQPPININELFQKLVASGFVKTQQPQKEINGKDEQEPTENRSTLQDQSVKSQKRSNLSSVLKPITFKRPETLKIRQSALYTTLYSGMQCSSCGMRFPPEASMWYSQHLDWHFRQNRRGKKYARVANSRKWYYSLSDWKNYEELEDLEEREKNYFDQQLQQAEVAEEAEEEGEIPTVPADSERTDERCFVCRDVFEQFFNEEKEEWHLKNAIKVDEETYHPVCYQDHQSSLLNESQTSKFESQTPTSQIIPGLEIILDDDDDEEEEEKVHQETPEEVVSLDDDEEAKESREVSASSPKESLEELQKSEEDGEGDDDVILNEVAPIKIVVDDDDDDEDKIMEDQSLNKDLWPVKKESKAVFDDGFVDVGEIVTLKDMGPVKIKSEPLDEDCVQTSIMDTSSQISENLDCIDENGENGIHMEPMEDDATSPQQQPVSHPELVNLIDGNMELMSASPTPVPAIKQSGTKIKINISKPLPVIPPRESNVVDSDKNNTSDKMSDQQLQSPDLEILQYKPALLNVPLKKLPPVRKGSELTGLCSIM